MPGPTAVATNTTQIRHIPLISNAQFRQAQTPVNVDNLVPKGTAAEQEAALSKLILDASTMVYGIVHQLLYATVDTEQDEIEVDRYGRLIIHPRFFPITQVTDLWTGSDPSSLVQATSLASCEVEPKRLVFTQGAASGIPMTSSAGPLEFGRFGASNAGPPSYGRWTYVNGWPVTTLAVAAPAGSTSLTVRNVTGIVPATANLRIEDGATREPVTVTSSPAGLVVPCAALANNHLAGESLTALPADAEHAIELIVTALVKRRGAGGLVAGTTAAKESRDPFGASDDMEYAIKILTDGDYVAVGGR